MDKDDVRQFSSDYFIPLDVHPEAPDVDACMADFPERENRVIYTIFWLCELSRANIYILEQRAQLLPTSYLSAALYRCGESNQFWGKLSFTRSEAYHKPFPHVTTGRGRTGGLLFPSAQGSISVILIK